MKKNKASKRGGRKTSSLLSRGYFSCFYEGKQEKGKDMGLHYNEDGSLYSDRIDRLLKERGYVLLSEVYDELGVSWRSSPYMGSPDMIVALDSDKYGIEGWHYIQDLPLEIRKMVYDIELYL